MISQPVSGIRKKSEFLRGVNLAEHLYFRGLQGSDDSFCPQFATVTQGSGVGSLKEPLVEVPS
jgi:hypothetical protein